MSMIQKIINAEMDYCFRKTINITPQFLKKRNIKGLILDVDNTLAVHDGLTPAESVPEWIELMKKHGIKLIIVSNNNSERVKPFADKLGIDFVCDSGKPLKRGYESALAKMKLEKSETASVGDQIFTDIWGGNFYGIRTIYVKPIEKEDKSKRFIRFKRVLEKPFLPKSFIDDKKENNK